VTDRQTDRQQRSRYAERRAGKKVKYVAQLTEDKKTEYTFTATALKVAK